MNTFFRKLLAATPSPAADGDVLVEIEQSWSDDHGVGVHGWVLCRYGAPDQLEISVGGKRPQMISWFERPDVLAAHPAYASTSTRCGFHAYISRAATHELSFEIKTKAGCVRKQVSHQARKPVGLGGPWVDGGGLFPRFIELANREKFRVLEVGSRVVCAGSTDKRRLFPQASSYVGFDYYPDANTDVVGDAHQLASYFPAGTEFDGIFSVSVLEHLAMPWVVAMEINRLLKLGGYTFHSTHLAWPLHETPWDFWRFSDEGLKAIFSPALGFEVIAAGLFAPMRLHSDLVTEDQVILPLERTFGGVAILARKVADVDLTNFRWRAPLDQVVGTGSHYPAPPA